MFAYAVYLVALGKLKKLEKNANVGAAFVVVVVGQMEIICTFAVGTHKYRANLSTRMYL